MMFNRIDKVFARAIGWIQLGCSAHSADTAAYSNQFGYMDPAAVAIYEVEIVLNNTLNIIEYAEEPTKQGEQKFRINLILVFDDNNLDAAVVSEVVQGGIGYNFTVLGLSFNQLKDSEAKRPHVTILIYGLPSGS